MKSALEIVATLVLIGGLAGCAATPAAPDCADTATTNFGIYDTNPSNVFPPMADHAAAPPGNQVKFLGTVSYGNTDSRCAVTALAMSVYATWTTSDAMDITISSAQDSTNGLATCTGTTLTPATITATYASGRVLKTASTQLACK